MFARVGRRLALLNAAVVIAVIALTGFATYLLMDATLSRESDRALHARIDAARDAWQSTLFDHEGGGESATLSGDDGGDGRGDRPSPGKAGDSRDDPGSGDDSETEGDELVESGDTLLFGFRRDGLMVADRRGVAVLGLPVADGVVAALEGRVDTRLLTIGGEPVRVRTEPVTHDGRVIGAIQAARGEGEREDELRAIRNVSLGGIGLGALLAIPAGLWLSSRAMRPIRAAFARQQAFVADASHELRTPLAIIRANTEVAQRMRQTPPEVRTELGEVIGEVDVAARLVDDLLLLARSDSATLPLRRERLDLAELVRAAAEPMIPVAAAAGLSLTVDAQPVEVAADPDRIQQALRVLIDNAIAYTPAGGAIRVSAAPAKGGGRVEVRDTGIGMSTEDRERVFERFYRTERSRSRESGGAGLGLSIAQAIVGAHGGRIGVESEPGAGSTFWFTLPTAG